MELYTGGVSKSIDLYHAQGFSTLFAGTVAAGPRACRIRRHAQGNALTTPDYAKSLKSPIIP